MRILIRVVECLVDAFWYLSVEGHAMGVLRHSAATGEDIALKSQGLNVHGNA